MPSDVRVISLNAGGAQTCALNRSREALCRGSFASGGESSSESANGLQISQNQRVTAQGAGSWAAGVVTKFVGNLFIKWGDASNSETLLFLGGLLGSKSNKETNERFQAMQKQLDALAETLTAVDKKATAILTDIKTLQCDDKLGDLDASVINIRAAMRLYQGTGNPLTDTTSYMAQVRDELTKAQQIGYIPTDLRPSMRKFVTDWHDKVKEDLARIDETLMNANYKTGPLGACLDKAFVAYQNQNGDKQFDDRRIWKGIYWIILKAMADQAMATQMLLDMNKFTAITALSDTAVEPLIPVINEGIEWQEDTLCADVDAHSAQAASNRRWGKALQACEENKSVTRLLYKNLVQQIELAGAPYSDKDVMLSMGADLLGKGSAQDSVLWLRSWETSLPGIRGFHDAWDMRLGVADFAGHGDANVYFSEGDRDNLGTWRSDGNIWTDLYENAKAAGLAPDRINMMADTMSEMDGSPLYSPAIKGVLFWMTGSTYRMNWRVVMGVSGDDAFKDDAKCFVGSGVGKVCSDREFGQLWGSGCYVTNEDYFPSRVTYKACGWASKHKQLMLDYDIGDISLEYWYRPLAQYDTDRYFSKVIRSPHLFPDSTSPVLYRMPVLKTKYRDCTSPMVIANQSKGRENFRTVASNDGNSKALPSRCGTDLDYFIDQMIQRPDVPDLEQLVRKPVYPAGVN